MGNLQLTSFKFIDTLLPHLPILIFSLYLTVGLAVSLPSNSYFPLLRTHYELEVADSYPELHTLH